MSQTLAGWLMAVIPEDTDYLEMANCCMYLYCVAEPVPMGLRLACDKEGLAKAFAALVKARFDATYGELYWSIFGASFHKPIDKGHWLEVMASVLKLRKSPDIEGAMRILAHSC